MAANLSAAKAGVWAEMPITYELAGAGSDVPVDDICFNWEDNHVYQNARGEFHGFWHAWRGQPTDYPRPSADLYPEYGGCSTNCSAVNGSGPAHAYCTSDAGLYCTSLGGHVSVLSTSTYRL